MYNNSDLDKYDIPGHAIHTYLELLYASNDPALQSLYESLSYSEDYKATIDDLITFALYSMEQ